MDPPHARFVYNIGIVYLLVTETLVRLKKIVMIEKKQRSTEKAAAAVVPARQQLILQQRWPLQKVTTYVVNQMQRMIQFNARN